MRAYVPEPADSMPIFTLFYFRFAPERKVEGLFKDVLPPNFFEKEVAYAESAAAGDAIILPNNFVSLTEVERVYIRRYADLGESLHKPVYVFSCGDHTDTLRFDPRVKVFRYSLYRSSMSTQDICTPTLTEDLGRDGISIRPKSEIPTISFCGRADFASNRELLAAWVKRAFFELMSRVSPPARAHIRGIFWRKWSVNSFKHTALVKTLFIIRKTFSGAEKTIELDPAQARKEFIDSLIETDFVLAPKGDGNYSNRFLEALSMGRIPVLIDTDAVLPLEDKIDYAKLVVRVPMGKIKKTPEYVREFYDALTEEEWKKRQQLARDTFVKYLSQDAFFNQFFSR